MRNQYYGQGGLSSAVDKQNYAVGGLATVAQELIPDPLERLHQDRNISREASQAGFKAARERILNRLQNPDKSAKYFAMAEGMLAPTKTGSFGESLGKTAGLLGQVNATQRTARQANEAKLLGMDQSLYDMDQQEFETEVRLRKMQQRQAQARIDKQTQAEIDAQNQAFKNKKLEAETRKILAEERKLNQKSGIAPDAKEVFEEKKALVKANVKRIAELSNASGTREAARKKAQEFLDNFESSTMESGTTRRILSWLPGVFFDQAQWDEELDSFAEQAARAQLKALGEIRPTDADVIGVKRSLFGIGRDEETNKRLLQDFINAQDSLSDELLTLIQARKNGTLSTFTGFSDADVDVEDILR